MPTKVTSVVLCDDIRKEMNGKDILIGVYSGIIQVSSYPMVLNGAVWVEIEPECVGEMAVKLKIETPSGNLPIDFDAKWQIDQLDTSVLALGGLPLSLERDGEVVISAQFGEEEMRVIKRKNVRRVLHQSATQAVS